MAWTYLTDEAGRYLTDEGGLYLVEGGGLITLTAEPPPQAFRGADASAYFAVLSTMLPTGEVWPRDPSAVWMGLIAVLAAALARSDAAALLTVRESAPAAQQVSFAEWEDELGLPDACTGVLPTVQQRRAVLVARYVEAGGQRPADLIALASRLGFPIAIEQFGFRRHGHRFGGRFVARERVFTFAVHAPAVTLFRHHFGGRFGERFLIFGNAPLECAIRRAKPAHLAVQFIYDLED